MKSFKRKSLKNQRLLKKQKILKKTGPKNIKKQGQNGGILLKKPYTDSTAFDFFMKNSNIVLLTDESSFGIILTASLYPGIESPYGTFSVNTTPSDFNEPVKHLLVKLVALGKNIDYESGFSKPIDTEENFKREINIQTDIFFKTMNYLDPLCPAPVFSQVFKSTDSFDFLNNLPIKDLVTEYKVNKIKNALTNRVIPWLGVLGMELADNYLTLSKFINISLKANSPDKISQCLDVIQLAKLQFLKLAIQTGYSQNDFHLGNALYNNEKILIIDFGFATKIEEDALNKIKELYNSGNYADALKIFKFFQRSDGLEIEEYPEFYGWLYNEPVYSDEHKQLELRINKHNMDPKHSEQRNYITGKSPTPNHFINFKIKQFINLENEKIDERIKLFNEKHSAEPEKYPLLPLSNAIKNKFYQGMIEPTQMDVIPEQSDVITKRPNVITEQPNERAIFSNLPFHTETPK